MLKIVDDHGELIGPLPKAVSDHDISTLVEWVVGELPLQHIVKGPWGVRNCEPQGCVRLVEGDILIPAAAWIAKLATGLGRFRLNVLAAAGAGVNQSLFHQSLKIDLVNFISPGLTPEVGWNLNAKPLEVFYNRGLKFRTASAPVVILQPEADAGFEQPGNVLYIYDMEHVPQVQVAGRAGGESGFVGGFGQGHRATFMVIYLILH